MAAQVLPPLAISNPPKLNKAGRRSGGVNPNLGKKRDGTPTVVKGQKVPRPRGSGLPVDMTNWRKRMQAKNISSGNPNELYDSKVREVLLEVEVPEGLLVGLRVDVQIFPADPMK